MNDPFQSAENSIDDFNRKGIAFIKRAVSTFLMSLFKPVALTTEVLFRKEFGERYFAPWNVVAGVGLISLFSIVALPFTGIVAVVTGIPWLLFILLNLSFGMAWLVTFLFLSILHISRIRERTEQGTLWHSYCCGYSRVSEKWQPAYPIGIGIGLIVCQIHILGLLMIVSGFISFQMRRREAALFYERVLDTIDARIEQEQLSDAVLKKSDPQATSGFVARLNARVSRKHREMFLQGASVRPYPSSTQAAATALPQTEPACEAVSQYTSFGATPPTVEARAATRTIPQAPNWIRNLDRRSKMRLAAVAGFLLLAWGAWAYYGHLNRIPGSRATRAAVEHTLNSSSQRVVEVSTRLLSDTGGNSAAFKFSATLETVEPLYTEIAVSRYLSEIGSDAGAFERIRQILTGPGGDWIRKDAGQTDAGTPAGFVLVRESAKANTRFTVTGDIQAHRPVRDWEFQVAITQANAAPPGSPRGHFTGDVLLLDRPEDARKFQASLASAQATLTMLEQSQRKYQDKLATEETDRRQALLAKLAPGTLFSGTASQGTNTPQPLWLEITDMDPDRKTVRAWLRNDGGWNETRRFEGTFELDTTKNQVRVTLKTDATQLIQSCGPFLEWNESYQWSLNLDGDSMTDSGGRWSYKFTRLTDDAKQAELTRARENETKWLTATRAGATYRLTASVPDRAWSQEYFFTFTRQEKEGLVIEGVLEFPSRGFRRMFTGTLITNKYKAGGKPLRLLTKGSDALRQAEPQSPLAYAGDYYMYPQLDDGRMRMDGQLWKLEFIPATAEELTRARITTVPTPVPAQAVLPAALSPLAPTRATENPAPAISGTKPATPADPEQLRSAAAGGDAVAQYKLGMAYLNATGVPKDRVEAEKWLHLSADQGYAPAQSVMGQINLKGDVPNQVALSWFQKAADQGDILSAYNLGCFYLAGSGVRKNPAEAAKWYRKAAEQGHARSQEALAHLYDTGTGVRRDYTESFKWHLKAAEQDDPDAQWNLAVAYTNGEGVQKDAAQALKWLRAAAKQGHAEAQKDLRSRGLTW